ncbi:pseudouridylate synthase 7 homolog isoform X2 [Cephus cinctus]|uniref:Pseudouridylate synthase 7 homolog isoform X2 n=1 Tax=Cephus cinctus TaxID=211228 RepID=A0AAJ7FPH8_CEPCN|nr:pseudouridylate synthase 7 homolog isoform X2 [Cephus cinctus]
MPRRAVNRRGLRGGGHGKRNFKRPRSNHEDSDNKRLKLEVGKRLKEVDIGVTEYLGSHKGFSGVVKERYADFHVHEITLNGEVAKLTNQDIPPEPEDLENMEELKKTVSQDVWDQLEMLMEADSLVSSIEINVTNMDKAERRAIHIIAKKIPNVNSQTVEQGKEKLIVVARANKQNLTGHKFRRDQRVDWARRGGNYCHFLLHKVNMDTMDALNQMALCLRMKSNMFNYAGTKDRRARTTQWVSLKRVSPSHILDAGKAVRGAYVGNFKFGEEPLRLGMLSGNRFRIALRNVTGTDEDIEKAMTSLRDRGFINYYGLQRFGTVAAIPTHEIGKALLQSKWHEAIELILKPRAGEQHRDLAKAREIYQKTKDPLAAYQHIGRPDKIEAKLLRGLHLCGDRNPQGALDWIPRNTRLMYIHAYQSFVWNNMVSKRIKDLGSKPIVGDLVYENPNFKEEMEGLDYLQQDNEDDDDQSKNKGKEQQESSAKIGDEQKEQNNTTENDSALDDKMVQDKNKQSEDNEETAEANAENINKEDFKKSKENSEKVKEDTEKDTNTVKAEKEELRNLPAVKILTEEDLPNYTLADVVMPQPGWRVTYPPYAKSWFDEILAKDGLTTDLRQKNKKYTLGGTYRKMMEIPSDLSWRIMRYKERYDDLILCDVDEMRGNVPPKDEPDGKYKALVVEMSLRPCTYATMALREILKCDTSPQTQAAQSAANRAQEDEDAEKKRSEGEKELEETKSRDTENEKVSEETKSEETERNIKVEKIKVEQDDLSDELQEEEMEITKDEDTQIKEEKEKVDAESSINGEIMDSLVKP